MSTFHLLKKGIAVLLSMIMLLGLLPLSAIAEEAKEPETTVPTVGSAGIEETTPVQTPIPVDEGIEVGQRVKKSLNAEQTAYTLRLTVKRKGMLKLTFSGAIEVSIQDEKIDRTTKFFAEQDKEGVWQSETALLPVTAGTYFVTVSLAAEPKKETEYPFTLLFETYIDPEEKVAEDSTEEMAAETAEDGNAFLEESAFETETPVTPGSNTEETVVSVAEPSSLAEVPAETESNTEETEEPVAESNSLADTTAETENNTEETVASVTEPSSPAEVPAETESNTEETVEPAAELAEETDNSAKAPAASENNIEEPAESVTDPDNLADAPAETESDIEENGEPTADEPAEETQEKMSEDEVISVPSQTADYVFPQATAYLKDILAATGRTADNNSTLEVDSAAITLSSETVKNNNRNSITLTANDYFDLATLTITKNKNNVQRITLSYPAPVQPTEPEQAASYTFTSEDDYIMLLSLLTEAGIYTTAIEDVTADSDSVELYDKIGDYMVVPTAHFAEILLTVTTREGEVYTVALHYPEPEEEPVVLIDYTESDPLKPQTPADAIWANDVLYLTGKMPSGAVVDCMPVEVEIDGEYVVAAYDIKIYANENQKQKGHQWQPNGDKVRVHFFAAEADEAMHVYHSDDGQAPELIGTVVPEDGWVTFEAEHFSTYALSFFEDLWNHTVGAALNKLLYKDTVFENDEIILTGNLPRNAIIEANKVDVSVEGQEALVAYDIKIYQNNYFKLLGVTWQPKDGTIQVRMKSDVLTDGRNLLVYHIAEEETTPEQVATVDAEDGAITFEAESFSAYAIVQGPEEASVGWKKVESFDELIAKGSEGLYIGHPDGYYYGNQLVYDNQGRAGISKTKPAQNYPPADKAVKYYFERVEGTDNQIYAYCYASDGTTKQYVYNGENNSLLFTTEENRTAFTVTKNNNGTFKLNNGAWYWNMQGGANGTRFCAYNKANDGNNNVCFWYYEEVTTDPYNLSNKSYGLMYWNDSIYGKAMTASPKDDAALSAKELIVMSKRSDNSDKLFVTNNGDISLWTFEWIEEDYYRVKTIVDGTVKYLSITNAGISLADTETASTKLRVIPGSGTNAGKISLMSPNGKSLTYSGTLENGFTVNGTAGTEWLYLVDISELTEDYWMPYTANTISVSDPAVKNGSRVIVYTRVWNDNSKKYEFYAIDHDGSLVRCYESGDTIQWLGGRLNTLLWNVVEYYWEGTSNPNGYYELYNPYSEQFIAPQLTGAQLLSPDTIGINLNGRHDGYYQTDILAWDEASYAYAGLKVENGSLVACPKAEAMDFYFATIQDLPVDDALTTVSTVDHKQYGITVKIKDYNTAIEANGQVTSQEQHNVLGTIKHEDGKYAPGMLSTDLKDNGYPTVIENENSLSALYSDAREVNHLFIESTYSSSGYYEFDSSQNFAHLNDDNTFTVYKEIATHDAKSKNTLKHGQFFPFNDIQAGVYASVNGKNERDALGNPLPNDDPRKYERLYLIKNPNYYFGVEIEATFTMTPNGHDAWGHDIIYEFTGDDDFWLYVDGELVIDLGGIHSAMPGSVNFCTGEVSVNGKKTTLYDLFKSNMESRGMANDAVTAKLNELFEEKTAEGETQKIFKPYTNHEMKIFYMERGAGASNLHMRFNLASVKPGTVELTKELDGIEEGVSVLAEFPYRIEYKMPGEAGGENTIHVLSPNNEEGITVRYKDTVNNVTFKNQFTIPGTEITYDNVFMVKPGETIVIKLPDNAIEYKITECGVNTDVYQKVTVNGEQVEETAIEGSSNRKDYALGFESTKRRPTVKYVNTVKSQALRTLYITKKLYKENGTDPLDYTTDATTFSLRLYLGTEFDTELSEARMYSYRIKSPDGKYCRWDAAGQRIVPTDWTEVSRLSDAQKATITFDTSIFGSIAKIPAFYTIEVPNILAGTTFMVQERPWEIPDGYSFQKYEYNRDDYTGNLTNAEEGVQDVVTASSNPQVDVCNVRGWGLRVNKAWSDESYMTSRDATYFAVYKKNGDSLTLVESTNVQDENGASTTIVRQMPYGKTSVYWYFPRLPEGTDLADYVIREVTLSGSFSADNKGNVTLNDATVTPIAEGEQLTLNGRQKGESKEQQFAYYVKYKLGAVAEGSQVRVDTVGNNRPGILLKKTDWKGNALAGAVFTLKDSTGSTVGTFTSDANGIITTAFLSNDGAEYTLTETKAPQSYEGLPASLTISQKNGTITVAGADSTYYVLQQGPGIETELTIKNKLYTFTIKKADADTNEPLEGVKFSLYKQRTVDGVTNYEPLSGYDALITNSDGIVPEIDNTLPAGSYQLREITPKNGYQPLSSYVFFTISETGVIRLAEHPEATMTDAVDVERGTVAKVITIKNRANALLTITKTVTGEFGDRTKPFTFTVTGDLGETVDVYENGSKKETLPVSQGKVTFMLRHGETIALKLPMGKEITISEANGNYTTTWKLNDGNATTSSGMTVTLTADATLAVTNHLNAIGPTNVSFATRPFLWMLLFGLALLTGVAVPVYIKKRKENNA